jgi:hypothetical protein
VASVMSPRTTSQFRPSKLRRGLVDRASTRTARPRASNRRATAEPTKPVAPVTRIRSPGCIKLGLGKAWFCSRTARGDTQGADLLPLPPASSPPLTPKEYLHILRFPNQTDNSRSPESTVRTVALSIAVPSSTSQRPDLLNHGKQKSGQPEQKHPVQSLQSTHKLPLLFQKEVHVAVACHCAERIEHRRPGVG